MTGYAIEEEKGGKPRGSGSHLTDTSAMDSFCGGGRPYGEKQKFAYEENAEVGEPGG